ncbi:hypothetical protein DL240_11005 [Lujinxingia litoralis]|uniref:Dickkopf N-terminal cysteine-rich domain-containing protein n=1 Tax=Lujinxingia litoralis TaxID=2211119 RepID=A0A328C7I7_9DELT|nr:hypothetical protein [Lujinxingia litoralis]RAL22370.1 hypothetical protein DL240_11005 [Lujinxingia litoralis]
MKPFRLPAILLLSLATLACQEPERIRDINTGFPGGSGLPATSSPGNRDTGADAEADASTDASADTDTTADAGCNLIPEQGPTPHQLPCCFTDQDCHRTGVFNASAMRCYASSCSEGGEGVCRVPPEQEQDCWTQADCPDNHRCIDAFIGTCDSPLSNEVPGVCQPL